MLIITPLRKRKDSAVCDADKPRKVSLHREDTTKVTVGEQKKKICDSMFGIDGFPKHYYTDKSFSYVKWQYLLDENTWVDYDRTNNARLSNFYDYGVKECNIEILIDNAKEKNNTSCSAFYYINFETLHQQNCKSRIIRPIRRIVTDSVVDRTMFLPLSKFSLLWISIFQEFRKTCNYDIIGIYKIKNKVLKCAYNGVKRNFIMRRGVSHVNLRHLWHGTDYKTIQKIQQQGFNRDFSETALYGKGDYFARDASYSASEEYAQKDSRGFQFVMFCSVLVGDFHVGNEHMKTPILKPGSSVDTYDSRVDTLENPSIFVTTRDNQALPEYLIEFIQ